MTSGPVAEPYQQDRRHQEPLTPGPIDNATPARFSVDANGTVTDLTSPNTVATPFGVAGQATDHVSLAARTEVESGARIWRIGTTARSNAANAQFWSLEQPSSPGFAERYGIPPENIAHSDFIESAIVPPGTPFSTRPAPAVGSNSGGGIEVVVPEGSASTCGFSIVAGC